MSMFNGPTKIAFGFGLGVMAARIAGQIVPAFRGLGRPLLKATVKSGMILARDAQVKIAEFREVLADVTAEAQVELGEESLPGRAQAEGKREFAEGPKQTAGVM